MKNLLKDYPNGMDLDKCINTFLKELENTRVLYIIRPNHEKSSFKMGISGTGDGHGVKRLKEHRQTFGKNQRDNACTGATILYLGVTKYDKNAPIDKKNTQVARIEASVKRSKEFSKFRIPERGTELYFDLDPKKVIDYIETKKTTITSVQTPNPNPNRAVRAATRKPTATRASARLAAN